MDARPALAGCGHWPSFEGACVCLCVVESYVALAHMPRSLWTSNVLLCVDFSSFLPSFLPHAHADHTVTRCQHGRIDWGNICPSIQADDCQSKLCTSLCVCLHHLARLELSCVSSHPIPPFSLIRSFAILSFIHSYITMPLSELVARSVLACVDALCELLCSPTQHDWTCSGLPRGNRISQSNTRWFPLQGCSTGHPQGSQSKDRNMHAFACK